MSRAVLRRRAWQFGGVAGVLAVVATAVVVSTNAGGSSAATSSPQTVAARRAARQFLDSWLDPDGRIVRRDQGGDTVSEGQAYGLLLAVAADQPARFAQIWAWTRTHLMQSNGLLAWRWVNGAVADEQSAADADVDAAQALLLAGRAFHSPPDTAAGQALAAAILAHETVDTQPGRVLLAGPWADTDPAYVDPSYLAPGTAETLAAETGATGWSDLAAGTRSIDDHLVGTDRLPPDWAVLTQPNNGVFSAARITPSAAPNTSGAATYGLDAPRLLVRLAASCDSADRALAARSAPLLSAVGQPAVRSLNGTAQVSWQHPLSDVAVAAVAYARGDSGAVRTDLAAAAALQQQTPTYYGAAWVALGDVLLTSHLLNACSTPPAA